MISTDGPHSRACGMLAHPHGALCSTNCPTCHGRVETYTSNPLPDTAALDVATHDDLHKLRTTVRDYLNEITNPAPDFLRRHQLRVQLGELTGLDYETLFQARIARDLAEQRRQSRRAPRGY